MWFLSPQEKTLAVLKSTSGIDCTIKRYKPLLIEFDLPRGLRDEVMEVFYVCRKRLADFSDGLQ